MKWISRGFCWWVKSTMSLCSSLQNSHWCGISQFPKWLFLCGAARPFCKEWHHEAQPPPPHTPHSWANSESRSITVHCETPAANPFADFSHSATCVIVSRIIPLKENHISSTIKQKEVNKTEEYLSFHSHCLSVWSPNLMFFFCPRLVYLLSHPHRCTHPADLYFEIFLPPSPFDYLYRQGQCYISYCTFLLADGCGKPYAFICRWHFYFHWMMRCPLPNSLSSEMANVILWLNEHLFLCKAW